MKVSLKWLQRYVPITASAKELAEVLPMLGFEVESVECIGLQPLENVVVGEVKSREQHPDADRLGVCQVQVGPDAADILQIVCGASNYKVGDRVPVALIGATLPGDFKIKKSKLRGVESSGMMCSAKELGLGTDSEGLLILEGRPEIGVPINQVITDNDVIFDLKLTANRGDCANHMGIARELAAYYDVELKYPSVPKYDVSLEKSANALLKGVEIESNICPLYTIWAIKGVKVGPSPQWLKKALESIGLRTINNIVDITNWIMMDCGQPLHAFDLAKIGSGKLIVREAKAGEEIVTLDEKKRVLEAGMLLIADSERPLAIAGIMGSLDAEVDGNTVDIILESAYFDPDSIRKTAKKLNVFTDSAYRFARNVDPKGVVDAASRAVEMIIEIAGGEFVDQAIQRGRAPRSSRQIQIDPAFIGQRCGFDVSETEATDVYKRLGFHVDSTKKPWIVTVPSFRCDIERPIDLVEEYIRIYGTTNIPASNVMVPAFSRNDDPITIFNRKASDYLIGQHFNECYHYSLREESEVKRLYGEVVVKSTALSNPLTQDYTHVRTSLIPGLWDALVLNQRNGNIVERLFETGRVIRIVDSKPYEVLALGFVIATESLDEQRVWLKRPKVDFYNAKNLILEVGSLGGIDVDLLDFKVIENTACWQNGQSATAGSLDRDSYEISVGMSDLRLTKEWGVQGPVFVGEIVLLPKYLDKKKMEMRFKSFSSFPKSVKDIALVMDESMPAETVRRKLESIAHETTGKAFKTESVNVFDVYQGKGLEEGKKSIAFSIVFRAEDRTLTNEEVMRAFDQIQGTITKDGQFVIRS